MIFKFIEEDDKRRILIFDNENRNFSESLPLTDEELNELSEKIRDNLLRRNGRIAMSW